MKGPRAILWAGDIALANGDYETAERFWRSIESIYPDRAALGYRFAKARFLSIRIEESQKMILALIASGIRSADLYNLLAWCYEWQDRLEDAIKALNEAIALEPAREGNYLDLATILETQKLYRPALEAAQRAVALAPRSLPAYGLKAFLETKVYGSFEPARRTFDQVIAQMPDSPEPLRALAQLQCDVQMRKDAAATLEAALKRFPRNALLYQDYARMLLSPDRGGDDAARARAARLLETALRIDESLPEVHYQMGRIALDENRFTEALPHLARAAELDPNNSKIHHMLGRLYRVMGRPADLAREMELFQKFKREEENIPSGIRSQQ
jgi:predicted Zn-dependent protease